MGRVRYRLPVEEIVEIKSGDSIRQLVWIAGLRKSYRTGQDKEETRKPHCEAGGEEKTVSEVKARSWGDIQLF
jgi:hypothetical protein